MGKRTEQILAFFKTALRTVYTPKEIGDQLGIPGGTVRREVRVLAKQGKIVNPKRGLYSSEEIRYRRHYMAIAVYCEKIKKKFHSFTREGSKFDKPGGKKQAHNIAIVTYDPSQPKTDLSDWLSVVFRKWLIKNGFGNCFYSDSDDTIGKTGAEWLTLGYSNKKTVAAKDIKKKQIYKKYEVFKF